MNGYNGYNLQQIDKEIEKAKKIGAIEGMVVDLLTGGCSIF